MSESPSANISDADKSAITPTTGDTSQQDVKPSTEHINLKVVGQVCATARDFHAIPVFFCFQKSLMHES